MQRIKIAVVSPVVYDFTSWCRCAGPLSRLMNDHKYIECTYYNGAKELKWNDFLHHNILFLQRPYLPAHLDMMARSVTLKRKVWIDYDDLLWDIPASNPASKSYERHKETIKNIIRCADPRMVTITVSVEYLADQVRAVRPDANVVVIPNALDETILWPHGYKEPDTPALIGWRGGDSHQADLLCVRDEIEDVLDSYPIEFIGMNPFWLKSDYAIFTRKEMLEYYLYLNSRKWDAFFVALEDTPFNRSKSTVAYLEAFFAGSVMVAPRGFDEWNKPGIVGYSNLSDGIHTAMSMTYEDRKALWLESGRYINLHLTLRTVNDLRLDVINNLSIPI